MQAPSTGLDGPYFDTDTVASFLGMRPSTLRTWRSTGRGPNFVRFGDGARQTVRYRLVDIERYVMAGGKFRSRTDPTS